MLELGVHLTSLELIGRKALSKLSPERGHPLVPSLFTWSCSCSEALTLETGQLLGGELVLPVSHH